MTDAKFTKDSNPGPVASARIVFARQKAFAEHALDQLNDEQFFTAIAPGLNAPAVVVQHLAGNLFSRWTDFFTTDGEKPTRDRDAEFEPPQPAPGERAGVRARIMQQWEGGWQVLFAALDEMAEADLTRVVTIRAVEHSVALAIARQLDHYAFHVGQLNVIARFMVGTERWKWFTLPPGGTKAFNEQLRSRCDENRS
ncbi:MAG: DUF1572 domain-containing protein [Leptolyngbya sp. PLA3]|nr:MAG: DUF1572 domain-containing protein [Cyanobacteria bacterium CYA]MCE7969051.1 DUF1572 domain-containing protein [Leptolyngbya sp. PL-A3]